MIGKNLRIFNWILMLWLAVACTTPQYQVPGFDYPIADIQKAVSDNLPNGIGFVSQNRRVFYSKVFNIPEEKKSKTNLVMRIIINGDRRPYDLSFAVKKTKQVKASIQDAFDLGEPFEGSESLSKRTALKIETSLTKRQKEKNLFDDFRPF
jgi:hypothetical protein